MKNKLSDPNNHLFAQLERLGDEDLTAEQIDKEVAHLSASSAPEGGAVKSMGQRAYENMRDNNDNASRAMNSNKSWAELSDEERRGWEEDANDRPQLYALATREVAPADHHERNLSMTNDELIEQALSHPPLDAPAEAGELEWKVDYNAVVAVSAHLQKQGLLDSAKAVERMLSRAAAYRNCRDAHAELAALRAQPQAREQEGGTLDPAFVAWLKERDCLPNDDDGTIEWDDIVCALNDWEADLTQAREDAQPAADSDRSKWISDARDFTERMTGQPMACEIIERLLEIISHPAPDALRGAISDIAAERQRQVDAEGWSAERDDEYTDRSLAHAAAAYALGFDLETRLEVITDDVSGGRGETPVWRNRGIRVPASWPSSWDARWWKPSDARRDLVKAGALIVAEIERLDRAALQAEQKGGA